MTTLFHVSAATTGLVLLGKGFPTLGTTLFLNACTCLFLRCIGGAVSSAGESVSVAFEGAAPNPRRDTVIKAMLYSGTSIVYLGVGAAILGITGTFADLKWYVAAGSTPSLCEAGSAFYDFLLLCCDPNPPVRQPPKKPALYVTPIKSPSRRTHSTPTNLSPTKPQTPKLSQSPYLVKNG